MKITIYDLLGMIKDGKAPKKIKYDNDIWEYIEEKENYIKSNGASLNWDYVAIYCLNETVEILEKPKGIPEKLKCGKVYNNLDDRLEYYEMKIDEIIDCLEYLESKGE